MKISPRVNRLLPNLDHLLEQLETEPKAIIPPELAADVLPGQPQGGLEGLEADETAGESWLEAGTRAVSLLRDEGPDVELTPEENTGLEAIVLLSNRPAILISAGHFEGPPNNWHVLEDYRANIETTFRSVGRVELTGHPEYDWVGTGFVVAPGVLMTNRHVAEVFCQADPSQRWCYRPGITARVDYVEEFGSTDSAEFAVTDVIGVHDRLDMALFQLAPTSATGASLPAPLPIAAKYPEGEEGRRVYVVGYPAWDGRRNDPKPMMRIFSHIFDVKRLQPGHIIDMVPAPGCFKHDCSTLGGNSGSCVVDLETGRVVGLHFGGRYLEGNDAISLWQLTADPLLRQANINFV